MKASITLFLGLLLFSVSSCTVYMEPSANKPTASLTVELLSKAKGVTGQLAIGSNRVCDTGGKMIFGDNKLGKGYKTETRIVSGVPTTLRFRASYTKSNSIYMTASGGASQLDVEDCGYKVVFTPAENASYLLTFDHELPQRDKCEMKLYQIKGGEKELVPTKKC